MKLHIVLDPDGTQPFGLAVIVRWNTGITYAHQCAGLANDERTIEGFAVPLGSERAAAAFTEFFERYHGWTPGPWLRGVEWKEQDLQELGHLVSTVTLWRTPREYVGTQRAFLELDRDRLDELTEAWVPVRTVYGPGVLVFPNSD